jgi:hypothetical protein
MAIQVTGLFKNPTSQLIHESPLLKISAHLLYRGDLHVDLLVVSQNGVARDSAIYPNLDRKDLTFDASISDPYDSLILALETFLIAELQSENSINTGSIFTIV